MSKNATIKPNASLSEKRRMAALIRWAKRSNKTSTKSNSSKPRAPPRTPSTTKGRSNDVLNTSNVPFAATVTPPKRRSKPQTKVDAPADIVKHNLKLEEEDVRNASSNPKKRKIASISISSSANIIKRNDQNLLPSLQENANNSSQRKKARKNGHKGYDAEARRQAAIIGWEKRRNQIASKGKANAQPPPPVFKAIPSLEKTVVHHLHSKDAIVKTFTGPEGHSQPISRGTTAAAAAATIPNSNVNTNDSTDQSQHQQTQRTHSQQRRTTRTSRRNSSSTTTASHKEIVTTATYLRLTRGWMEFHPSSRLGSGTAIYGYIPASIAKLVRSGILKQSVVLERGVLGVHYALDFEGEGGLREMVERYGLDYAPYPNEEMMMSTKELEENRVLRMEEWDLSEDLNWKGIGEEEKRLKKEMEEEIREKRRKWSNFKAEGGEEVCAGGSSALADGGSSDFLFVASILASLDTGYDECKQDLTTGATSDTKSVISFEEKCTKDGMPPKTFFSDKITTELQEAIPAVDEVKLPPRIPKNEPTIAVDDFKNNDFVQAELSCNESVSLNKDESFGVSCRSDVTKAEYVGSNALFLQARFNVFKHWNFGLC